MIRSATTLLLALALSVATLATSSAGVPDPVNSTLPPCMVLCPMGDASFTVVVRDLANNPLNGVSVTLDYSGCPNAYLCDPLPSDPYTVDLVARTLTRTTDGTGTVVFPARVGGTGPAGCAKVYASGVFLRSYALATPDQDSDGQVVLFIWNDQPLFTSKLGTADPTADFDCNGTVDAADQLFMNNHGSHSCWGLVDPVRHRSWGSLKQHYR